MCVGVVGLGANNHRSDLVMILRLVMRVMRGDV